MSVILDQSRYVLNLVYDENLLAYVPQPLSVSGGPTSDVTVLNFPSTYPVTDNGGSLTVDGTVGVSGSVAVTGPLTDAELRATAVPVSGTVTANAGTGPFPVSDNGGSLTVDGTVAVSGTVAVTDNAGSLTVDNGGTFAVQAAQSGTWTVTGTGGTFPVTDSGGSLTVDGTVTANATAYATRLEEVSSTLSYIGDAVPGTATATAAWRVKRLDTSAGVVLTYADGNANFDNTWDGRAGFSYS